MPESKPRRKKKKAIKPGSDPESATSAASQESDSTEPVKKGPKPSPRWWAPTMLGLMVFGLIWIVVYYLSQGQYPISPERLKSEHWNLAIGLGFVLVGFAMTSRWR